MHVNKQKKPTCRYSIMRRLRSHWRVVWLAMVAGGMACSLWVEGRGAPVGLGVMKLVC